MKKRYVLLITIIISFVIFIGVSIYNKDKKTYVYEVDITTNDYMLKDFVMVSTDNSLYIPNTFYFEKVGENEESDLSISIIYNNKEIMSWALTFDSKIRSDFGDVFIDNLRINTNDEIIFRLKYKVDGKEQELDEAIDLSECIRYSN